MKNTAKKIMTAMLAVLAIVALCMTAGCGNKQPVAEVMIIGVRENVPVPDLGGKVFCDIVKEAVESYGYVGAIAIDSNPEMFLDYNIDPPAQKGLSNANLRKDNNKKTAYICDKLKGCTADDEEADILMSLYRASEALNAGSLQEAEKRIIIADNGMSTAGVLDFSANNYFDTDTAAVIKDVRAQFPIDLSNVDHVVWYGIGSTEGDQAALYPNHIEKLKEIWRGIIEDAGSTVTFMSDSLGSGKEAAALPHVSQVPILYPGSIKGFDPNGVTVLSEAEVSFVRNECTYIDEEAAKEYLRPIADYMNACPDFKLLICGTTASSGTNESCVDFSVGRAQAAKDTLVDFGVDASRIAVKGLGYKHMFHVDDLKDGELIEGPAQKNRSVVIMNADSEIAKSLSA